MNKKLNKNLSAIDDQDLTAVSGGVGNWWEEYGLKPEYSVGQRVHCIYYTDDGKRESYSFNAVGTIKNIEYIEKCEEFFYVVELDTPDSNGEKCHYIPASRIIGLA